MLEGYSTVSWGTLLNPPNWSDYTAICLCGSKFQLLISNMIMVINPHFCRVLYNFVCPLIVSNPFLVRVLIMFQSPSISFPPLEVERDRLGRIGVRETQTPWLDRQQWEILKADVFLKSWMAMEIAPRTVRCCWWNNSSTSWYGKNLFFSQWVVYLDWRMLLSINGMKAEWWRWSYFEPNRIPSQSLGKWAAVHCRAWLVFSMV